MTRKRLNTSNTPAEGVTVNVTFFIFCDISGISAVIITKMLVFKLKKSKFEFAFPEVLRTVLFSIKTIVTEGGEI